MTTERESIRKLLDSHSPMADWLHEGVASGRIRSSDDIDHNEEIIVVGGPEHGGVDGAKQAKCGCGAVVWISPSTQEMMAKRGPSAPTIIVCIPCLLKNAQTELEDTRYG